MHMANRHRVLSGLLSIPDVAAFLHRIAKQVTHQWCPILESGRAIGRGNTSRWCRQSRIRRHTHCARPVYGRTGPHDRATVRNRRPWLDDVELGPVSDEQSTGSAVKVAEQIERARRATIRGLAVPEPLLIEERSTGALQAVAIHPPPLLRPLGSVLETRSPSPSHSPRGAYSTQ